KGLFPPCGTAISVTVDGTKTRNGEDTGLTFFRNYFSPLLALLEIAGPKDGKLPDYVKKFVLFERKRVYEF
ncbi:hypothetical protein, partial [Anaerospora sp.]|uniref:hypothetical protein n=1 Tax=Anaerospora sp. TaxID=1960278 RepID=UPI002897A08B